MNPDQVRQAMGNEGKLRPSRDRNDERILWFADGSVTVTFAEDRVVEIGLAPPTDVIFEGRNLFREPNAWKELVERDGDPKEIVGFLVLRDLGVTLTGFHDNDEAQKAVTVFERGRWDDFLAKGNS
jgi:hypothetical protein